MTYPVLPVLHGYSIHKRPTFATTLRTTRSGREVTNFQQEIPLWEFELTYEILQDATQNAVPWSYFSGKDDLQRLAGLFAACGGEYGFFYFEDTSDNSRAKQDLGVGNGVLTDFRLLRTISYGAISYTEPVGGINTNESFIVYVNDVAVPSFGNWTISTDLRFLIFDSPVADGDTVQISYFYYYLCRFISNDVEFEEFMYNRWLQRSLRFRSISQHDRNSDTDGPPSVTPFPPNPFDPPIPPGDLIPDELIWVVAPSFGTAIGAPYVINQWGGQRSDVDTGFPSGVFNWIGSTITLPMTGDFLVKMLTFYTKFIVTTYHIDACFMKIVLGNCTLPPIEVSSEFFLPSGDITDTDQFLEVESGRYSIFDVTVNHALPITIHMEIRCDGTTGLGGGNIFPAANNGNIASPFHPGDASFIVKWWSV